MFGKKTNRQHNRAPFAATVALWQNRQPQMVQARDLSAGGLFISTSKSVCEGDLLTLRLSLPGYRGFTVLVRVVRNQHGRAPLKVPGIAVKFVDIAPKDRQQVSAYVNRFNQLQAAC